MIEQAHGGLQRVRLRRIWIARAITRTPHNHKDGTVIRRHRRKHAMQLMAAL